MIFEKVVRIPSDRLGALIGKDGSAKAAIEESCGVALGVDSESGQVLISASDAGSMSPFKAAEIVSAIGRGFSPDAAMELLHGERMLSVIDMREFAGKSPGQIERVKGRIIGEGGKARRNIESLSGARISVYGRTVAIIGGTRSQRLATDAITSLCRGSMHGAVYGRLESARRREKEAKMELWEDQNVI